MLSSAHPGHLPLPSRLTGAKIKSFLVTTCFALALAANSPAASLAVYVPANQSGDVYTAVPGTPVITGSGSGDVFGVLDATATADYTITINSGVNIIANTANPGSSFQDSIVLGDGTHIVNVNGQLTAGSNGLGIFNTGTTGSTTVNIGSTGNITASSATAITLRTGGTVNNAGTLVGSVNGVLFNVTSGTVNNQAGGIITATTGTRFQFGGTLSNAGQINGNVLFDDNASIEVNLITGGQINGDLNMSVNTAAKLTLSGAGTQIYSNAVTGATTFNGTLTKEGTGDWTLDVAMSYAGDTVVEGGGDLRVTEAITGTANTYVGYSTGNNRLFIQEGGSVEDTSGTIGVSADSDNNSVYVIGAGSAWTHTGDLNVGYEGAGNTLYIQQGGSVSAAFTKIGGIAGAEDNEIIVQGAGSSLTHSDDILVGYGGSVNGLAILDGGTVSNLNAFIGFQSTASNNYVTVDNGTWNNSGTFHLGYDGASNTLSILNGGVVNVNGTNQDALLGFNATSTGNTMLVSGAGSKFSNDATFYVGNNGSGNSVTVEAGGVIQGRNGRIGGGMDSTGNSVTVTGPGSLWSNSGTLRIGSNGSLNYLEVSNGGKVTVAGNAFIGYGATADANSVYVTGSGSEFSSGTLTIGRDGDANEMTVDAGAILNTTTITIAANELSGGVLQIGTGGAAGIVNATSITGGAGFSLLAFNHNESAYTFSITLGGNLSLLHDGPGTTILTGTNSYEGATTIENGFIQFSNGANFGASMVTLDGGGLKWAAGNSLDISDRLDPLGAGGGKFDTNGNNVTLASVIGGDGGITKIGSGILTLTAANTYLGGTTILGGFVEFFTGANLGTGNITLNGGGLRWAAGNTLDISSRLNAIGPDGGNFDTNGNNVTLGVSISGSGAFTKMGAGVLTLAAANTYTGGTNVNEGTLLTAVDNALPSGTNLTLGTPGTGVVGTIDLAGTSQTVNSIGLASGNTGGAGNKITSANGPATLTVSSKTTDSTFSGQITGPVTVIKEGAGTTLTLLGHQTYTGGTLVNGGGLILGNSETSSSIAGDVIVAEGAFFGGAGTVGGNIVNSGMFGPGYSPGSLEIAGDFTLESTSLLVIEVASKSNFDKLTIGGTARLNGRLRIVLLGGYEPESGDEFAFLTARGVRGRFSAIEQAAGGLFEVVLSGNQLILVWGDEPVPVRNPYQFYAENSNQYNVASALEALRTRGTSSDFNNNIRPVLDALTPSELRRAFDAIMPSQTIAFAQTVFARSKTWLPLMAARLADARARASTFTYSQNERGPADLKEVLVPHVNKWGAWVDAGGIFNQVAGFDRLGNGDGAAASGTVGGDYRLADNIALGLYAGYVGSWTDFGNGSEINSNGSRFGLYSTYQNGGFYLNHVIGGEWNSYDWQRRIAFPGIDRTANADTDGTVFETAFGGGYDWKSGALSVGLFGGLEYTLLFIDGFTEDGAGALNLRIQDQDADSLRTNLGVQVAYEIPFGEMKLRPSARAAWRHEYLDASRGVQSNLAAGAGPGFTTVLPATNRRDSALVNAGVSLDVTSSLSIYAYYTGDIAGATGDVHAVNTGVRWEF